MTQGEGTKQAEEKQRAFMGEGIKTLWPDVDTTELAKCLCEYEHRD